MKVNRIIALRLMLSVAVIIGFASCSKIKFKSASRATGWNVDIKKLLVKQVAGPGLILWREELYDG
jgi:hypothetical protein